MYRPPLLLLDHIYLQVFDSKGLKHQRSLSILCPIFSFISLFRLFKLNISGQMSSRWPRTEIFPKLYQMFNAARPTALSHSDPGLHCLEVVKLQTQVSKFADESEPSLTLNSVFITIINFQTQLCQATTELSFQIRFILSAYMYM